MGYTIELTEDEIQRVRELVAICKKMQGEYVGIFNKGWATSYSTEFVNAATELFKIYSQRDKISPPIRHYGTRNFIITICDLIADLFSSSGIRSCRGSAMNRENMRYLFDAYILRKLYRQ